MPSIPNGPGNPVATPFLFSVSYPAAVGTAGPSINVGTFLAAGSQVRQGPAIGDYSDAWIELINYSDSMLSPHWDQGPMEPFIPPGQIWSARIPVSATTLFTTIVMQTAAQFFSNELLAATFYTDHDIRSGYRPRIGPLVPSVPAAAIGPGALSVGVGLGFGVAQAVNVGVTTTVTVLTVTPASTGTYRVSGYLRLNNLVSGNILTGLVHYTDPDAGGATLLFLYVNNGSVTAALNGANNFANGPYPFAAYPVRHLGGAAITVSYTDPTNTPNDFVTAIIERLA